LRFVLWIWFDLIRYIKIQMINGCYHMLEIVQMDVHIYKLWMWSEKKWIESSVASKFLGMLITQWVNVLSVRNHSLLFEERYQTLILLIAQFSLS
jgi:hypothetical protein